MEDFTVPLARAGKNGSFKEQIQYLVKYMYLRMLKAKSAIEVMNRYIETLNVKSLFPKPAI